MEYLSKERYDQIVAELNTLTDVEYPRIKDALAEARAQGDLSENALSKVKDEKGIKRVEKFLRLDVCPDCRHRQPGPDPGVEGQLDWPFPVGYSMMR